MSKKSPTFLVSDLMTLPPHLVVKNVTTLVLKIFHSTFKILPFPIGPLNFFKDQKGFRGSGGPLIFKEFSRIFTFLTPREERGVIRFLTRKLPEILYRLTIWAILVYNLANNCIRFRQYRRRYIFKELGRFEDEIKVSKIMGGGNINMPRYGIRNKKMSILLQKCPFQDNGQNVLSKN